MPGPCLGLFCRSYFSMVVFKTLLVSWALYCMQVLSVQQSLLTNGGCLLRSKGFVWLASCPDRVVEWSSSGLLLEVCLAHPWFATLPEVGITAEVNRWTVC